MYTYIYIYIYGMYIYIYIYIYIYKNIHSSSGRVGALGSCHGRLVADCSNGKLASTYWCCCTTRWTAMTIC